MANAGVPLSLDWIDSVRVNTSAVERRTTTLVARRTIKKDWQIAWLLRAITCMDLTTLSGDDTEDRVRRLCAKAMHPVSDSVKAALGIEDLPLHVAAVCVYHLFVETARRALEGSNIRVAAVSTGFPAGLNAFEERLAEIRRSVDAGAHEIDVVITRAHVFGAHWQRLYDEIAAFKEACGAAHCKVILGTGDLATLHNVARASWVAMMAGADFIKTSTGKESVNATLPVGLVMTRAIREYCERTGMAVGLKPAGGLRTAKQYRWWRGTSITTPAGGHTSPELQYLEAQFAALLSYGVSARILSSVLPLEQVTSVTTWKRHVARVGRRLDEEVHDRLTREPALNEFGLPTRNPLRAVGIDGGYVKASDAESRQEGWFEVMVGKSLPRQGNGQVLAFVHRLEPRPSERMERFLAEQGVFPAQATTFLSDGGETVRQAQGEFREFGEPILDWFHVAMRVTQLSQAIKGLAADTSSEEGSAAHIDECLHNLRRAKAYLWHGSPHRALHTLDDLTWDVGTETARSEALQEKLEEFINYITTNVSVIPNYADRHRHGEPIATGFVESAVNQVVSKRFVKKQQMRWTPHGAHSLLQVRARVLNQQLRGAFERWHPQLRTGADPVRMAA